MIYVDGTLFSTIEISNKVGSWKLNASKNRKGRNLYTACLKNPFDIIGLVLFARELGEALLLLPPDTPIQTALENANRVGSDYLIMDNGNQVIPLAGTHENHLPGLLQFSSGTTGEPKLVFRSWEDIDIEVENYNWALGSSSEECPLILVPVSHSFGLIAGVLSAIARNTIPKIIRNKNPKFAMGMIHSHPSSLVYGVPYLFHLYDTLSKGEIRYHKLLSSGAPMSEALFDKLISTTKGIWHQYGSSETGCISLGENPSSSQDVGKPLGHLTLSFNAVHTSDSAYEEIVVSNGVKDVLTKDIGHLSQSGSLHVLGRCDDLINVSGLKVIPSEVESVIGRMPEVREVVVHRISHKIWGEAIKAQIVPSSTVNEQQLKTWCLKHLPTYKVPSVFHFVNEIPKMPSGKVSRKLLQDLEGSK